MFFTKKAVAAKWTSNIHLMIIGLIIIAQGLAIFMSFGLYNCTWEMDYLWWRLERLNKNESKNDSISA